MRGSNIQTRIYQIKKYHFDMNEEVEDTNYEDRLESLDYDNREDHLPEYD